MPVYSTRKATDKGRAETLRRRQVRAVKYVSAFSGGM